MATCSRTITTLLALCLILALTTPAVTPVVARQDVESVTLYHVSPFETLDPQMADGTADVGAVTNLFLGLTDISHDTGSIVPQLATHWEVNDDGRVWTFYLRDDVPWVRWDPAARTSIALRTVTAHDFVYAFQRLCDPRLGGYSAPALPLIDGCAALWNTPLPEITDNDLGLVQVFALDNTTLEVHLLHSAGYFLTMSSMWLFHAVPRDIIEQYGDDHWTDPGTIATNGPFMLDSWTPEVRMDRVANPHLPADLRGPGNIERVVTLWGETADAFALYEVDQVEFSGIPSAERERVLNDPQYANQLRKSVTECVHFFFFSYDNPPFDSVHVRRAFSAAIDRQAFIDEHVQGVLAPATPMTHFTPPGVFGGPPVDEIGVGYDPNYARAQLALGGYPDCAGLLDIRIWTAYGPWGEALASSFETVLGCDPDRLHVEVQPVDVIWGYTVDPSLEDRPEISVGVWCPDYRDANNYLGDYMECGGLNPFQRPCNEIDDLIDQAAREFDPVLRNTLYRDIEERFFGAEGEYPLIPLILAGCVGLEKPWFNYAGPADGSGGSTWDWYTIDQEAQAHHRGGV